MTLVTSIKPFPFKRPAKRAFPDRQSCPVTFMLPVTGTATGCASIVDIKPVTGAAITDEAKGVEPEKGPDALTGKSMTPVTCLTIVGGRELRSARESAGYN